MGVVPGAAGHDLAGNDLCTDCTQEAGRTFRYVQLVAATDYDVLCCVLAFADRFSQSNNSY